MKAVSIRMPEDLAARIDSLVPFVAADRNIAALGSVTSATVIRLALARGVEILEEEFGPEEAAKGRRRR